MKKSNTDTGCVFLFHAKPAFCSCATECCFCCAMLYVSNIVLWLWETLQADSDVDVGDVESSASAQRLLAHVALPWKGVGQVEGFLLGQPSCSLFWRQAALGTERDVSALSGSSCVKGRKPTLGKETCISSKMHVGWNNIGNLGNYVCVLCKWPNIWAVELTLFLVVSIQEKWNRQSKSPDNLFRARRDHQKRRPRTR